MPEELAGKESFTMLSNVKAFESERGNRGRKREREKVDRVGRIEEYEKITLDEEEKRSKKLQIFSSNNFTILSRFGGKKVYFYVFVKLISGVKC